MESTATVAHPAHYGGAENPYECIKVIEAWGLGFCLGNALKYISRAGKKPGEDAGKDLSKAVWYLQRELDRLEDESDSIAAQQALREHEESGLPTIPWAQVKADIETQTVDPTAFDRCPEVKPGQVWSTKEFGSGCGRHEYLILEKTLGKVNGQWQNGVTYRRADQLGPRLFWRDIEDFCADFEFVRDCRD